ncbi:MAG: hypothetical protein ACYDH6_21170 [Acidimicrobiales bacterium]
MPYHLETGPTFEVHEDFANGDTQRLIDTLVKLRKGVPLCEIGVLDSTTLDGGPYNKDQRHAHTMCDWYGMSQTANGAWAKQKAFNRRTNPTTGYWQQWYGDAEGIMRTTLIRAAEVALGMYHDEPIPDTGFKPARHWPIQFLIKCTQPWFEGWISWRSETNRGGMVTVILCTPGVSDPVLTSPLSPPQRGGKDYQLEPRSCSASEGLWVITHEHEVVHRALTTEPTAQGKWSLPHWGPVYVGTGAVVTVNPSEADGGVLPSGRAWTPPAPVPPNPVSPGP